MTFRTREEKLAIAVDKLRKYFGIKGAPDNAAAITAYALGTTTPRTSTAGGNPAAPASGITPSIDLSSSENQDLSEIMRMLIDVQQGAYSINQIIEAIREKFGNNTNDNLKRLIQIITDVDISGSGLLFPEFMIASGLDKLAIAKAIDGRNSDQKLLVTNDPSINQNTANPTRTSPNVSLILLNSPMTSLVTRSGNACSLFMNSIPTIEMSRAVPYLEVSILQPIPAISEDTPRLLAPSIYKFLLGGVQANPGSPMSILQRSKISNETYRTGAAGSEETQFYTELGMEAFTSPQIMVNGDDVINESNRIQPVLDKFRPFLSLTSFSTSEVLSYAANGYRTAQLSMTLHDRSRLAEIAPLIKSEFRGNTQIIVEFGWSHPDGNDLLSESSSGLINYYGWLINGMRRREKYQIVNNSFSFTENGEVNINLNLATVGTVEMNTVNVTDGIDTNESIVASLQEIENVRQAIVRLSDRFVENQEAAERAGGRTRELNGVQILESASDTFNNLILSDDQRRELRQFLQATRTGTTAGNQEEIAQLRRQLIRLYGEDGTGRNTTTRNLRVNVINAIASKLSEIANFARSYPIGTPPPSPAPTTRRGRPRPAATPPGADPFLVQNHPSNIGGFGGTGRLVSGGSSRSSTAGTTSTRAADIGARDGIESSDVRSAASNTGNVSLATLISNFIVHPLAKTGLYEEIQVIFYPFNDSAGYASQLNIAQFSVDLSFFQERYIRYRLENISRTGTMTLGQFWTFLQENIVEDLAARSYGLYDSNSRSALLVNPDAEARRDGALPSDAVPADDGVVFTSRLNSILRNVTPDGNWRQPQLAYLMETLSQYAEETTSTSSEAQQRKSILRMHIYDRQSTAYGTLGELLLADRRRLLNIPVVPPAAVDPLTNEGVPGVREQYASQIRAQMINGNLIRQIPGTGEGDISSNPPRYEVIGGPRAIKDFMCANMPYILPGIQNSLVTKADLQSQQDAAMASLNMINAPRAPSVIEPNGVEPGNLPVQIVPVELQLETYGCPLISFAGQYFVDFNTGTSADDIYAINGIDHTLNQGDFKTSIKMRPITGYGQYRNFVRQLNEFAVEINNLNNRDSRELAAAEAAATEAASGRGTGGISGEGVRPGAGGGLGGGSPGDGSVGGFA